MQRTVVFRPSVQIAATAALVTKGSDPSLADWNLDARPAMIGNGSNEPFTDLSVSNSGGSYVPEADVARIAQTSPLGVESTAGQLPPDYCSAVLRLPRSVKVAALIEAGLIRLRVYSCRH